MELPVGQHFIISVALSIAKPSLTLCVFVLADMKELDWSVYLGICAPAPGQLFAVSVMHCYMST